MTKGRETWDEFNAGVARERSSRRKKKGFGIQRNVGSIWKRIFRHLFLSALTGSPSRNQMIRHQRRERFRKHI